MPDGSALTTKLVLNADRTFSLITADPVYPASFKRFSSTGSWILDGRTVILNPDLEKRKPRVRLNPLPPSGSDSVTIRIRHRVEWFENEQSLGIKDEPFDIISLYLNNKRKPAHLITPTYSPGSCAWAPRARNPILLSDDLTVSFSGSSLRSLEVFTYGFRSKQRVMIPEGSSDSFELELIIPIDKERTPRSKEIHIRGKKAWFYEHNGKPSRLLQPVTRKE